MKLFSKRAFCTDCAALLFVIRVASAEPFTQPGDSMLSFNGALRYTVGQEVAAPERRLPLSEISVVEGLPSIGKWMYQYNFQRAHWLGVLWEGKSLIEPINLILVDPISKSSNEAIARLYANLQRAGYKERKHHSSGYVGYIHRAFYMQLPRQQQYAFSNEIAEVPNNHGRVFGPCFFEGKYYFTGAFSREGINPMARIRHSFESFNRARDDVSQSLDRHSSYKIVRFVELQNTLIEDERYTTGDHDGIAAVLELSSPE
jgi:hypothetical protein